MQEEINHLIKWLPRQVEDAKVNGLLVGISGGLDSAVVAHLIERACPGKAIGVVMPIQTHEDDLFDAKQVVETSGIKGMTVDLTHTHKTMLEEIKQPIVKRDEWQAKNNRLADANLRARLRMSTLYTIGTNYHYLVVGTDNLAEWYTGYFTKYGDGGVDILPLVQFTKGEVRKMAESLGVPQSVIDKNPSADLWEGQSDEQEIGTTYDKIDAYLTGEKIPSKDQDIIERLHQKTAHKRHIATHYIRNITQ